MLASGHPHKLPGNLSCIGQSASTACRAQITIFMSNPALTALLAWAALGEPLRPATMAGIAVSLSGVVLVARPTFIFGGAAWTPRHVAGAH